MFASDFLSIRDFTPQQIRHLLDLAMHIKAMPQAYSRSLRGKTMALIFEKPSLRTRVSFDVGIQQLGGFSVYLSPAEINLGKREGVYDVAKNLERMVQGIMIRTFAHRIVEDMAAFASIPIINGLTDYSHPCQAMADYMTIFEAKGRLSGLKLAYVGDGNNVAHSLMFAGAQLGVHVWVATPDGYEPDHAAREWATRRAAETGGSCTITNDPVAAVEDADVIYTDVWASMGQESEAALRKKIFLPYQVNGKLFAQAKPDTIFMHCLPAHRGDEVTDEVIDSPRSFVFPEAENRLHAQKAIMLELMRDESVEHEHGVLHEVEMVK
ncbi:ornithine carbamoyltransferase [Candidatus Koribacter versatilis Ellin345]|uniref:Ornithine carbamoyltransferase n=1 Tax=Koribacter versatilis (strain Ellin345) TaxID=204669 RepID=Q1IQN0_KORVE|nr:ornithine carbamoyltransferase [Candidatus Koribacter versatilis]ABF40820.1 ornithine carbamoyltransferase [Candidatus Koribacter versatilis Ellin345]